MIRHVFIVTNFINIGVCINVLLIVLIKIGLSYIALMH